MGRLTYIDGMPHADWIKHVQVLRAAGFDESLHPRDDHGRFTDSGEGHLRPEESRTPEGNRLMLDELFNLGGNEQAEANTKDALAAKLSVALTRNDTAALQAQELGDLVRAGRITIGSDQYLNPAIHSESTDAQIATDYLTYAWGWGYQSEDGARAELNRAAVTELGAAEDGYWTNTGRGDPLAERYDELVADDGDTAGLAREFMRVEYDYTQEWLAQNDIKGDITLYRGFDPRYTTSPEEGERVEVDGRPLSSWTTNIAQADEFGSVVLKMTIPVADIASIGATGLGAFQEQEVVVLNKEGHTALVVPAVRDGVGMLTDPTVD